MHNVTVDRSVVKIGLIIYGDLNTISGGYLYDRMLVRELRRHGHVVETISLPWRNYPLHLLDNLNRDLTRKVLDGSYDLLLQDELNHPSLIALNLQLRTCGGPPIVTLVHHLRCHEDHSPLLLPLYRAVERQYLKSVDYFLVNSWTTRYAVETVLDDSASQHRPNHPSRIFVAQPAADHLPVSTVAQLACNIDAKSPDVTGLRLAFVGNVIERKAVHVTLECMRILAQSFPRMQLHLDVIGSLTVAPGYVERLRAFVTRHNLQASVRFHGRLSDESVSARLQHCHVFVMPSFEGFGIVYLEAMAHGLCPIASIAGAADEVIEHSTNGFLVPPNDPLALANLLYYLYQNPEVLKACCLAARREFNCRRGWGQSFGDVNQWLCEILSTNILHPTRV